MNKSPSSSSATEELLALLCYYGVVSQSLLGRGVGTSLV